MRKAPRLLTFLFFAIGRLSLFPGSAAAQDDPPGRVARLNYIQGSVSYQVSGDQDWVQADPNRPLTTGDNLWADKDSRGEVHIGSTAIRMSSETGISFLTLDDRTAQLQLAQGTIEVHLRILPSGDAFEIDTPNLALTLTRAGEYQHPDRSQWRFHGDRGARRRWRSHRRRRHLGSQVPGSNTLSMARTNSPTTLKPLRATTISKTGANRAISVRTHRFRPSTFRAISMATTISMTTVDWHNDLRLWRGLGAARRRRRLALRITSATGSTSRRGAGRGLTQSPGASLHFTMADGPCGRLSGAGCPDRSSCVRCMRQRWSDSWRRWFRRRSRVRRRFLRRGLVSAGAA